MSKRKAEDQSRRKGGVGEEGEEGRERERGRGEDRSGSESQRINSDGGNGRQEVMLLPGNDPVAFLQQGHI